MCWGASSSDVCDDVVLIVRPEDFYDEANRKIFAHMLDMHQYGRKLDPTLLIERLKSAGDYERVGAPHTGASFPVRAQLRACDLLAQIVRGVHVSL